MAELSARRLQRAERLCAATVAWNLTIGGGAVATAVATGSLSLIGFGVNAVVDSSVSALLVWRFRAEARGLGERARRVEQLALRVAAGAFTIVAAYVLVRAALSLASGKHPRSSLFGIGEALASLLALPYLALAKYRLSVQLGSRALRADSLLTVSGVALAAIALAGLILQRALGWWWADPVAAVLIGLALGWQGSRTLRDAPERHA
jgi:divalent metal cation (Fe/Co/Zn/Cd) transporter